MNKSEDTSCQIPGRKRGRPRAFDREAALSKATCLFWRKGYEATSISDLTDVMGIGAPSLYAAFGSKEALYVEALRHYHETYENEAWAGFRSAATAREAIRAYLMDSAKALAAPRAEAPAGCMVTLSAVGSEGHAELGEMVRDARAVTFQRLKERMGLAVAKGEISNTVDIDGLARFIQTVQSGMSILARDGATQAELETVALSAMAGWDVRVGESTPT